MNYEKFFEQFPYREGEGIILKKIDHTDDEQFVELISNEVLYQYKPGKAKKNKASIVNMIDHYERDFNKKKMLFIGIYLNEKTPRLIGIGEVFDLDRKVSKVTFGYTINQDYWGHGYATKFTSLILKYLFNEIEVNRVQAFVMPENVKSLNVLERSHFVKEGIMRQGEFWKDKGVVDLVMYSMLKEEYTKSK